MKTSKLLWIPRILAVMLILFISMFGLDVFAGDAPLIQKLGGLFNSFNTIIDSANCVDSFLEKTDDWRCFIYFIQFGIHDFPPH